MFEERQSFVNQPQSSSRTDPNWHLESKLTATWWTSCTQVPCYVRSSVNAATDKDVQRAYRFPLHLLVKLQSLCHHWAPDSAYSASGKDMTNYLESKHCSPMILCHCESFESKMMSRFCYCSDLFDEPLTFVFLSTGQIRQTVKKFNLLHSEAKMNWMENLRLSSADPLTMVRLSGMSLPGTHKINTQLKEAWPRSHQCLGIAAIPCLLPPESIKRICVCM